MNKTTTKSRKRLGTDEILEFKETEHGSCVQRNRHNLK